MLSLNYHEWASGIQKQQQEKRHNIPKSLLADALNHFYYQYKGMLHQKALKYTVYSREICVLYWKNITMSIENWMQKAT